MDRDLAAAVAADSVGGGLLEMRDLYAAAEDAAITACSAALQRHAFSAAMSEGCSVLQRIGRGAAARSILRGWSSRRKVVAERRCRSRLVAVSQLEKVCALVAARRERLDAAALQLNRASALDRAAEAASRPRSLLPPPEAVWIERSIRWKVSSMKLQSLRPPL